MQNNRMRSQEAYDRSTIATARAIEHAKAAAYEKQRASEDDYQYLGQEFERVNRYKETEPAICRLFRAKRIRQEREADYDRTRLGDRKDSYLESVKEEIQERALALKFQVYEIGRLLLDAKNLLNHGEFRHWLQDQGNFPLSWKTAHNCMNVYKTCLGHPDLVERFPVSALYVICRPSFPQALRQQLFDNVVGICDWNQKELLQTAMKYKAGEIELDGPEVRGLLLRQKKQKISNRAKVELDNVLAFLRRRSQKIEALRQQSQAYPLLPVEESSRDDAIYSEAGSLLEQLISLTEDKIKELSYAEKE